VEVSGFTVSEAIEIGAYAESAMKKVKGKPHFWCGLLHGDTIGIRRKYDDTIETIDGYDEYQKAYQSVVRVDEKGRTFMSRADNEKLITEHSDYLAEVQSLKDEPAVLTIRKMPIEWRSAIDNCEPLLRLLTEYDLWESTDKLRDALYAE